jgi:hypothetical protein
MAATVTVAPTFHLAVIPTIRSSDVLPMNIIESPEPHSDAGTTRPPTGLFIHHGPRERREAAIFEMTVRWPAPEADCSNRAFKLSTSDTVPLVLASW